MAFDMLQIDGVNPLSAPVFAADCSFPVTDWSQHVPPDDVLANMPIRIGNWADGTIAPQINGVSFAVVTTGVTDDDCNFPVVTADMTSCDQVVPNMRVVGVQSPVLNIRTMIGDFCRRRRILPNQLCIFDQSGNFAPGDELGLGFRDFVMDTLTRTHAQLVAHHALVGDDSNEFEPDGLYTQLTGGWANASGSPGNCDTDFNTEAVIDWNDLTGGTGNASPNDLTIDLKTVTIWGETHDVPAGLNLVQLLERFWFDKVEHDWTANRGTVTQWEMHMPHGMHRCLAEAATCIQPCAPNEAIAYINDLDLRDRMTRSINSKAITMYPTNRVVPTMESNWMPANTLRIGPRTVGGRPTYGLFFDDLDRYFTNLGGIALDGAYGYPPNGGLFPMMNAPDLRNQIEDRAIHWDIYRTTPLCFTASIMAVMGVIACSRHLWLRIDNVSCPTWYDARTTNITVDGVALS